MVDLIKQFDLDEINDAAIREAWRKLMLEFSQCSMLMIT
jgi:hypothetical protein